jgi:hypothetical protein
MTDATRWFAEQSAGAPQALQARAAYYLEAHAGGSDPALVLAAAARDALAASLDYAGDRAAALDLLAADALVTLALKARATTDPAGLGAFAAELSHTGAGSR